MNGIWQLVARFLPLQAKYWVLIQITVEESARPDTTVEQLLKQQSSKMRLKELARTRKGTYLL